MGPGARRLVWGFFFNTAGGAAAPSPSSQYGKSGWERFPLSDMCVLLPKHEAPGFPAKPGIKTGPGTFFSYMEQILVVASDVQTLSEAFFFFPSFFLVYFYCL